MAVSTLAGGFLMSVKFMANSDFIGLAVSYAYATGLLVVGEVLRRLFGLPADLTRKLIHIGAGMWVFGVLVLFNRWESGILPFASLAGRHE